MVVSTFVIAVLGTWITEKIVIPRLGPYNNEDIEVDKITRLDKKEKKGLKRATLVFAGIVNLVMGSASAKWALMASIFVPMFMFLGYTPELTQVVYRIGDSVTNIISPMMSFFALIIVYFQKYDNKAGIGTLLVTMLPYTIIFLIGWLILLIIWLLMGWNLGPGAPIHL